MEQSQENLNKFEIEERIEAALPIELRPLYNKHRLIKEENVIERIKSTEKREAHWNTIIQPLVGKYILELNKQLQVEKQAHTYQIMSDQNSNELSIANTIANAVKEGIDQAIRNMQTINNQPYNTDSDLFNKPTKYNGSRDPFLIDNWIKSINDYKEFKGWNDEQTFKFARTLLCDIAAIWLRNIELNEDNAPTTWSSLRIRIITGFKPTNSALIFCERLEELRQTSSISQYIQDFLTLKLGVPSMTDDEAVSKFARHLKSKDARVHIRNLYRGDKCPTMDEAIQAAYIFESARNEHGTYSFLPNSTPSSSNTQVDDPMDLSPLRDLINYMNTNNRGTSRGSSRGGFRGGFRGRGFSRGASRGANRGNFNGQEERSCFQCGRVGHLQYHCPQNNRHEMHFMNNTYDNQTNYGYDYYDGYEYEHRQNDYDYPQQPFNPQHTPPPPVNDNNNKDPPSSHYSKETSILYSVLPSSAAFVTPLKVNPNMIQKDVEFMINAGSTSSKLPFYRILINGHPCNVLIDSGASANYIHPKLIPYVSKTARTRQGQSVETANGQQTAISTIASFSIALGDYTDRIEAYVFATKFDVILGRSWLSQIQPVPHWPTGEWQIKIRNNSQRVTIIRPLQAQTIEEINEVSLKEKHQDRLCNAEMDKNNKHDTNSKIDFVITAKQLDTWFKKQKVEECYLINFSEIYSQEELHVMMDEKSKQLLSDEELKIDKMNEEWSQEFAKRYPKVFKGCIDSLPPLRDSVENMIVLGPGAKLESRAPYKMSPVELRELRRQLDILLDQGLIEPTSSKYGSPVLFVKRAAEGNQPPKLRMVCDFRSVNKATISQRIPVPRIDECLEQLHGAHYFTSLDLQSGFHQQRLTESDAEKTTINTRYGQFRWKVIAFGLRNSGAQFMKMMTAVLKEHIDKICIVYIDDILIFTKDPNINVHRQHVHMIMHKLDEAGLVVNRAKCKFNRKKLTFLGYDIIANVGVLPSKKKVEAIMSWPVSKNVQDVRKFIGLCQYYKSFLPSFASVAAPITDLTKGGGFKRRDIDWSAECQSAFDHIKQMITSAPVLLTPCMTRPFRIETDSSDFGCRAVLLQQDPNNNNEWKPLAYESHKFSTQERAYPAQEREYLGILHALRTWRCFIDGNEYEVHTDHLPLKYYQDTTKISPRLVRWMSELSMFSPKIVYKPGVDNIVPDFLSRRDGSKCIPNTESFEPRYLYDSPETCAAVISSKTNRFDDPLITDPLQDWPLYYFKDEDLWPDTLKAELKKQQDRFRVKDGHIWRKYIDKSNTISSEHASESWTKFIPFKRRADLVEDFHRGFGHQGKITVHQLMKTRFWWPKMLFDITNWLSQCPECQLHSRKEKDVHHAPMKPLEVPPPFSRWHLDFIGEFPLTKNGNKWIIMAVDYNTCRIWVRFT
ncbi:hypothetical protein INT47_012819 [Mucor saturninus]|uniref:RNA-directed DNA polymerase n=1 Tax=Mucor saturninus TaxID=64648 RepID=A0A8H7QGD0_9FUNG|nr:hypothetical protein INT47_012819 [Mucor saturninus]